MAPLRDFAVFSFILVLSPYGILAVTVKLLDARKIFLHNFFIIILSANHKNKLFMKAKYFFVT